ncbi:hypothetical protein NK718_11585 [Alsobacter sp. SYSU M60028]|uniref:Hpt domain-containing protein n=1 Tax=Alsobacter ponti TaxID=2962936 RepID=A0ABT1LCJ8_9HYPH|nr:hypothetical protein [Alsobacter ponti]MCP8939159.1 hypothetical protein [Alsobacter ponti]
MTTTTKTATHEVIHPPATLRDKALSELPGPDRDPEALIARAQEAVERLAPSFDTWLRDDVAALREEVAAYAAAQRSAAAAEALRVRVQNLRGSCAQFGYPLAADVAGQFCLLLEDAEGRDADAEALLQFVDAIGSIVRGQVRDGSDLLAAELVRALRALSDRLRQA